MLNGWGIEQSRNKLEDWKRFLNFSRQYLKWALEIRKHTFQLNAGWLNWAFSGWLNWAFFSSFFTSFSISFNFFLVRLWTWRKWFARGFSEAHSFPQITQENFWPKWTRVLCLSRWFDLLNSRLQASHL